MIRNQLWIGSIKDSDGVWHPVISSPDEDYCHRYCEHVTGDYVDPELSGDQFYTNQYTVELVPIIISEETLNEDEWTDFKNWYEAGDGELYMEEID